MEVKIIPGANNIEAAEMASLEKLLRDGIEKNKNEKPFVYKLYKWLKDHVEVKERWIVSVLSTDRRALTGHDPR